MTKLSPGMAGSSAEQDARAEHSFRSGNPVKICVRRSRTPSAAKPRYCFHSIRIFTTYSILPIYRACRDARRRVETGVSPTPKGGRGGHPPHIRACTRNRFFAYQPQVTRRREPPPVPSAHHCHLRRSRYKSSGVSRIISRRSRRHLPNENSPLT